MFRVIIAVILLAPVIGFCQTQAELQLPAWWIRRAGDELQRVDVKTDRYQEMDDLIVAIRSYYNEADWNSALDEIERLPDVKANFHLDIFTDMAERYAQLGALEPAREALDRARDSPVARAPSCRASILAAKLRIDAAANDFDAAMKDIQNGPEADRVEQYRWLEGRATAAHRMDVALRCLSQSLLLPRFDQPNKEIVATHAIDTYRFKVLTGQTAMARLLAMGDLAPAQSVGYAVLAGYDLHHNHQLHAEDVRNAVASTLHGFNLDNIMIVSSVFEAEGDVEGTRACADATELAQGKLLPLMSYDYYQDLARLQLRAREFEEAEKSVRNGSPGWFSNLTPEDAHGRMEAGDVNGAMRQLAYWDDSNVAYDIGHRLATDGQLEKLRIWITPLDNSQSVISACCGAAAALSHQPATRPQ